MGDRRYKGDYGRQGRLWETGETMGDRGDKGDYERQERQGRLWETRETGETMGDKGDYGRQGRLWNTLGVLGFTMHCVFILLFVTPYMNKFAKIDTC